MEIPDIVDGAKLGILYAIFVVGVHMEGGMTPGMVLQNDPCKRKVVKTRAEGEAVLRMKDHREEWEWE